MLVSGKSYLLLPVDKSEPQKGGYEWLWLLLLGVRRGSRLLGLFVDNVNGGVLLAMTDGCDCVCGDNRVCC